MVSLRDLKYWLDVRGKVEKKCKEDFLIIMALSWAELLRRANAEFSLINSKVSPGQGAGGDE